MTTADDLAARPVMAVLPSFPDGRPARTAARSQGHRAADRSTTMSTTGQITAWQWFRLPAEERRCRAAEFRAAGAALQMTGEAGERDRDHVEAEARRDLDRRVCDLWPTVPWWCRL